MFEDKIFMRDKMEIFVSGSYQIKTRWLFPSSSINRFMKKNGYCPTDATSPAGKHCANMLREGKWWTGSVVKFHGWPDSKFNQISFVGIVFSTHFQLTTPTDRCGRSAGDGQFGFAVKLKRPSHAHSQLFFQFSTFISFPKNMPKLLLISLTYSQMRVMDSNMCQHDWRSPLILDRPLQITNNKASVQLLYFVSSEWFHWYELCHCSNESGNQYSIRAACLDQNNY